MAKEDGRLTVSGLTKAQWEWIEEEAKRIGVNMSAVIKGMVQWEIDMKWKKGDK